MEQSTIELQELNTDSQPLLQQHNVVGSTVLNRDGLPNSDHWETPEWLYNKLNDEFQFDYDPCPLYAKFDGLKTEWGKSNFVNPPYNRYDKPKFIAKAFSEWQKGKTCVLLIPSATGTLDFHNYIWDEEKQKPRDGVEIRFIKGRVSFKGINNKGVYTTKNKGKHDSMLIILRGR